MALADEVQAAIHKYAIVNHPKYGKVYPFEIDGFGNNYFMDDATFQKELSDDQFYADVRKKYGSRGVAQAKKIKEQTSALFAGGELSEEDQANFIKEMEALFLDAKEEAKKFTPKKYL